MTIASKTKTRRKKQNNTNNPFINRCRALCWDEHNSINFLFCLNLNDQSISLWMANTLKIYYSLLFQWVLFRFYALKNEIPFYTFCHSSNDIQSNRWFVCSQMQHIYMDVIYYKKVINFFFFDIFHLATWRICNYG